MMKSDEIKVIKVVAIKLTFHFFCNVDTPLGKGHMKRIKGSSEK